MRWKLSYRSKGFLVTSLHSFGCGLLFDLDEPQMFFVASVLLVLGLMRARVAEGAFAEQLAKRGICSACLDVVGPRSSQGGSS